MEEASNRQGTSLEAELDAALAALESALAEAGRAAGSLRGILPEIAALDALVGELEAALTRIRPQRPAAGEDSPSEATAASPLRLIPPEEASSESPGAEAIEEPGASPIRDDAEEARRASPCLRLEVKTRSSSLDLKALDGAVNENPAVLDVALLDYDGRSASLKIWIESSADPDAARESLLESLERHLADTRDAEVHLDFEEKAAA